MITCIRTKYAVKSEEQFLEERKQGFGGSDMGDLCDSEPYGCKRRLFLERLGLLPVDPENKKAFHMERGKFLEAPIAQLYSERTKRQIKLTGTGYVKEYPFIRANADRLIIGDELGRGVGVLEVKAPGQFAFKKIQKEGLPESYILQLQWQMLCYGTARGAFAVYWADGHELITFDVQRDNDLCQMLMDKAIEEWENLSDAENDLNRGNVFPHLDKLPPAKTPTYTGCERCQAYEMCHGFSFDATAGVISAPEFEAPAMRYLSINKELAELEEEKSLLRDGFTEAFNNRKTDKIMAGVFNLSRREQSRESLSAAKVKAILPEDKYAECLTRSTFPVINVKEANKWKP
jgi:putative phage-type endonuclease